MPGFHISGKFQTIEDLDVSRLSQISMSTRNGKHPDHLGWSGKNLENRERFNFTDALTAMVVDHSRHMKT